ncbi:UNVERIFIED_CONTAM: hypothetical protein Sangu_2232900, partial [Sesamum angustifolium]
AEILEKKYQEKYKQVAEIHSKLTIEEASFREIQERKMELHQAITKMEQGGSADGILQVRADRIQSDLEELLKALTDRCKKHGVETKSAALIELPPGWHPGIPEVAAIWDEDWDKFEDEGFSFDVFIQMPIQHRFRRKIPPRHVAFPLTRCQMRPHLRNSLVQGLVPLMQNQYSADESKSHKEVQGGKHHMKVHLEKIQRIISGKTLMVMLKLSVPSSYLFSLYRSFDESAWVSCHVVEHTAQSISNRLVIIDPDHGKHDEKHFFGSNDFGASSERSFSPHADSAFQKNSPFTFEDSVPGTPHSRTGNSPRNSVESRDAFFDNFSRYDSFSTHDRASSPRRENLTRFDSINSTRGFDHSSNYSFDDSDPFGSSGPFKVSAETPKRTLISGVLSS